MFGDAGQRAEHGDRLGASDDVQIVDTALVLAQPQPLGEEEEVEQSAFGGAGQVLEGGELDLGLRLRIGPDGGVVDTREVRGQMHPLTAHRSPVVAYWLAGLARPRCSLSELPG